jgi:predicted nuclease of predicted toxin-antitoxin system
MRVWVDAQLSPAIARCLQDELGADASALRDIGLRDAEDGEIFQAARIASAIVMTKDSDFVSLVERFGPPPQIVWVRCGNTSNANLRAVLLKTWTEAVKHLEAGEALVEIRG